MYISLRFFQSLIVLVLNDVFERCRLGNTIKSEKRSKKEHRPTTVFTISVIEKCVVSPFPGNFLNTQRGRTKMDHRIDTVSLNHRKHRKIAVYRFRGGLQAKKGQRRSVNKRRSRGGQRRLAESSKSQRCGAARRRSVKFIRGRWRIYDRTVKILTIKKKTKEEPADHCRYNG